MKKGRMGIMVLALALLLCSCAQGSPDGTTTETVTTTTVPTTTTVRRFSETYYFLYSEAENKQWVRDYIGENDCEPGYLYVKNFTTGEITRVMDIPLKNFVRKEDVFYVVTMDDVFLKREADGSTKELYRFQHGGGIYDGEHDPVSYSDEGIIFMMDGDYVVRVDTATDEVETVTRCEQAEYLYIVDEQSFIWRDESKVYRWYTMDSDYHMVVESVAMVMSGRVTRPQ